MYMAVFVKFQLAIIQLPYNLQHHAKANFAPFSGRRPAGDATIRMGQWAAFLGRCIWIVLGRGFAAFCGRISEISPSK